MLPADACNWHKPGQRGGDLKTLAATPTFAFGDFGHQEDRLEPYRHRLQIPKSPSLSAHLAAAALRTDHQLRPHR